MATKSLIEKIEALPPGKRVEVEDFVEFLSGRAGVEANGTKKTFPDELLERIRRRRERMFREHGPLDTLSILRDLRENGPR